MDVYAGLCDRSVMQDPQWKVALSSHVGANASVL